MAIEVVNFLIQNNMPPQMINRLIVPVLDYARDRGYNVWDHSLTTEFNPDIDVTNAAGDPFAKTMIFGSVGWVKAFDKVARFSRRLSYNRYDFSARTWYDVFKEKWINHAGLAIQAHHMEKLLEDQQLHLRPAFDDKVILGGVYDSLRWQRESKDRNVKDDLWIWASPIVEIEAEYRCWVINNEVVEISQYRRDGEFEPLRITDPAIFVIASAFAYQVGVRTAVMDLAISQGTWKFLELNPIHCSGWYAADIPHILDEWVKHTHIF
jgi:ATP-grasp domain, R2K clade family 3